MKLKITVEGKTYEVEVEIEEGEHASPGAGHAPVPRHRPVAQRPPAASSASPSPGAAASPVSEEKVCRSPILGTVVKILVNPGDTVQADQPLLVLEAMKMETSIASPVAGTVKRVLPAVGDSVKQGDILVEFE